MEEAFEVLVDGLIATGGRGKSIRRADLSWDEPSYGKTHVNEERPFGT